MAGRPPQHGEAMISRSIRLTPAQIGRVEAMAKDKGIGTMEVLRLGLNVVLEGGHDAVKRLELMHELEAVQTAFRDHVRDATARVNRLEARVAKLTADKKALWDYLVKLPGAAANEARSAYQERHSVYDVQEEGVQG